MALSVLVPLMAVEDYAAHIYLTCRSSSGLRVRRSVESPASLAAGGGAEESLESKSAMDA